MNILIIEPSRTFQNIIEVDFSVHGVTYQIVSTAAKAKDILSNQQFDLICMSLHLPDIYGLDFCEQLRQSDSTSLTPILLLTAEEDKNIYNQAFKLGVTDIFHKIVKPIKLGLLTQTIASYLTKDTNMTRLEKVKN